LTHLPAIFIGVLRPRSLYPCGYGALEVEVAVVSGGGGGFSILD
jgi:hypothetical protein